MREELGTILVPGTGALLMVGDIVAVTGRDAITVSVSDAVVVRSAVTVTGVPYAPAPGARYPSALGSAVVLTAALMTSLSGIGSASAAANLAIGQISSVWRVGVSNFGADVEIEGTAQALVSQHESLVRELITLLRSETRRRSIRLLGFQISRFDDPEEGDVQLVVSQKLPVGAETALAYWDEVGRQIQALAGTLPEETARILSERIAVNVDWNDGDSTIRPA